MQITVTWLPNAGNSEGMLLLSVGISNTAFCLQEFNLRTHQPLSYVSLSSLHERKYVIT
jgi:hypothetical protein